MPCQALCQPYLIVPAKGFFRVLRKLNIIGRVCIDEITSLERDLFEVSTRKLPLRECRDVF